MMKENVDSTIDYHEFRFFLIMIPLANALNYFLTYTNIHFNAHTLLTFTIDTLTGYAAWLVIRAIIKKLDRKLPYGARPLRRILVQLLLTCVAGLGMIIFITEMLNWIIVGKPIPSSFYRFDIFIFLIWLFVFNGIYVGIFYYRQWNIAEQLRERDKKVRLEGFAIKTGKQNIQIPFADTAGIFVEGEYAALVTIKGKKHLLDQSLDKVEKLLPPELFFRLNRQYIVHRNRITGFERVENGKINVLVAPSAFLPTFIQVSRTKAPGFKSWFQESLDG